jgi:hypothetical protein
MTDLTAIGYLDDAARTGAQQKTAFEQNQDVIRELMGGGGAPTELTMDSGGSVTIPIRNGGSNTIDTYLDGSPGTLNNIIQTNTPEGRHLIISPQDTGRSVIVKHNAGGAGEILLNGSADYTMDNILKWVWLQRIGTIWRERARGLGADTEYLTAAQIAIIADYNSVGVKSDTTLDATATVHINNMVKCTQAVYNATTKDADTLYIIVG